MLKSGPGGHAMRIRGQEGERPPRITFVFGQMKRDAPEQVPQGIHAAQIRLGPFRLPPRLLHHQLSQLTPQATQQLGRQILQAAHRRSGKHPCLQLFFRGRLNALPLVGRHCAQVTDLLKEPPSQFSPEYERRRKLALQAL